MALFKKLIIEEGNTRIEAELIIKKESMGHRTETLANSGKNIIHKQYDYYGGGDFKETVIRTYTPKDLRDPILNTQLLKMIRGSYL